MDRLVDHGFRELELLMLLVANVLRNHRCSFVVGCHTVAAAAVHPAVSMRR
jgi:hypothetical protein